MTNHYEYLLKSISVGHEDRNIQEMTKGYAVHLLGEIAEGMKGVVKLKNNAYESNHYYMYVGLFPLIHVAIDTKAGTTRLFSIYNKEDYLKIKSKLSFV